VKTFTRSLMVQFEDIQEALVRIKDIINHTPVMSSRTLNAMLNASVYFKCENFQRMGAFKFRGAYNAISQLTPEQQAGGIITHSSGNHAQAVALAAQLLGIHATIVMPDAAPRVKVEATRGYGGEVVFCENTLAAREATTNELIDQFGYTLIHPYDNDSVICGQGTAALELLQEVGDLNLMFAPVGGGGLVSGTAIAAKGFNPEMKVYACEPQLADDAYRSMQVGKIQTNDHPITIADGLRTNLCDRTFTIIQQYVDQILLVSEEEILAAMRFLWERMKIVVEPSGAVPLAAVLSQQVPVKGQKIGVILSGGNVDLADFFQLLESKITKS